MQHYKNWNFAGIVGLVLAAISAAVNAQQRAPWPSERFNPQPQQNTAGDFDYYALVLSWSPTYCSTNGDADNQQCNRNDGKRFSFVVHGLWPQYEKGYPELCRTARKPFVPQPLVDSMLDIMPSSGLIVHEYRNHGTCSGLPPESYFGLMRRLYGSIRIPEAYSNPFESQTISPGELISDLTKANPQLTPGMIAIACGGAGNRLKEIHICFSKDGKPRRCGGNEDQARMCSSNSMFVPPVRSTAHDGQDGGRTQTAPNSASQYQKTFPRPRLIEGPNGN